jgi:hypothetical protein
MDQDDTIIRHFLQRGLRDEDGQRHSAKLAWRALAALQLEIEAEAEEDRLAGEAWDRAVEADRARPMTATEVLSKDGKPWGTVRQG